MFHRQEIGNHQSLSKTAQAGSIVCRMLCARSHSSRDTMAWCSPEWTCPLWLTSPDVGPQVQQLVHVALVQQPAGPDGHALCLESPRRLGPGAGLDKQLEHSTYPSGAVLVDDQLPVPHVVAERHLAPH